MDNQNQPKVAPKARPPSSTGSNHRDGQHDVVENLCLTSVHSSLSKLLLSEKFSDMTILCGGHEFKAHRAIVCTQSSFFDGAFSTSFKEAASKTIELPEDDPEVIKRFLEFLYTGSYTDGVALNVGKPSTAAMLTPEEIQESLNSPPGIIIDGPSTQPKEMARKVFDLTTPPLTTDPQAGRSTTSSEDPPADDGSWSTQTSEKDDEEPEEEYNDFDESGSHGDQDKDDGQSTAGAEVRGDFFMHLRLYIMADKYDVPALRLLARDRFYREVEFTWEEAERFPELVDELYRNTPPTDTAMREIVCRLVGNRILDDDVREKMRPVMVEHGRLLSLPRSITRNSTKDIGTTYSAKRISIITETTFQRLITCFRSQHLSPAFEAPAASTTTKSLTTSLVAGLALFPRDTPFLTVLKGNVGPRFGISSLARANKAPVLPTPRNPERSQKSQIADNRRLPSEFSVREEEEKRHSLLDLSTTSSVLASKHGKNVIRIWSVREGVVQSTLKFSAYTEAQARSREYLIRSHAILSEASGLIAIATRFGRSIDIWRWTDRQCLQSIDYADRWAACQFESYETGRGTLAVYHGQDSTIDVYTVAQGKKPFSRMRTIDLRRADLPFTLQYPELALSATSPMLVAAAGPRQTRAGHPPPEEETLLVAWEIRDNGDPSSLPYKVARPWQHKELDTALPCELATYGSFVVSIWIPASYRVVPMTNAQGTESFHLSPAAVPFRYVLVWDLVSNSTRTFKIPNTASCISPDCRLVAYCEANRNNMGGRGCLAILDIITGKEIWCWPDRDAIAVDSGPKAGFEQFESLDRVTQLTFSADGKFLVLGDSDGQSCIYKIV
ncbi:hypothetical protein QQX98_005731 [Neonectria punicea]|uniref:BTB domain-containing protein n=1 Tax=Neonectria punicea TaxID=979145 RepID=A0ABR1H510_9HYPO